MATGDKKIGELPEASAMGEHDLLLLEQDGVATRMSGMQLLTFLQPLLNQAIGLLPRTTSINFSGWDSGYFSETLSDGTSVEYPVLFDSSGMPINVGGIYIQGVITVG